MKQGEGAAEVTIREFRLEDYDEVLRLWTEAGLPFRPQGRDRRDRVAAELKAGTAVFLLAEAGGRLAGVVLGTHDGRKAWINRLAVAPEFQRRGIASLLIREVEARLEALGLEIIAALVESDNEASLRFFHAIGYEHAPEIEYFSRRRSPNT
jgi:ribosomal protein S18 acetylase RimI-like enzyme